MSATHLSWAKLCPCKPRNTQGEQELGHWSCFPLLTTPHLPVSHPLSLWVQAALQGVLQRQSGCMEAGRALQKGSLHNRSSNNKLVSSKFQIDSPALWRGYKPHQGGKAMPSPTKQALLQPPALGDTSHCAHNVIQLQLRASQAPATLLTMGANRFMRIARF